MFLFIKFVLILGVFITSTFIGYTLANRYRTRVAELNDLLLALEIFETKIKYTYDSLTTSFFGVKKTASSSINSPTRFDINFVPTCNLVNK